MLYDSFAQPESDHDEIDVLVDNPRARRVVVYTWNFHPDLIDSARGRASHGYLSKTLPARDLVAALEAVHAGEIVVSDPPPRARSASRAGLARPRRGPHRPGVGDPGPDHPGQEQRRGRRADLPQPQHRQVLHPHHLPQDRRRQPHPGRAVGRQPRLHPRPPPHRPLADLKTVASASPARPAVRVPVRYGCLHDARGLHSPDRLEPTISTRLAPPACPRALPTSIALDTDYYSSL